MKKIELSNLKTIAVDDIIVYYPNQKNLPAENEFDATKLSLITPYTVDEMLVGQVKLATTILIAGGSTGSMTRLVDSNDLSNGKWWIPEEGETLPF